jgi:hypothetical protein
MSDPSSDSLSRLVRGTTGGEPAELTSGYLFRASSEGMFHQGTGVPVVGATKFVPRKSGLWVPAETEKPIWPLDLAAVYLIPSEIGAAHLADEDLTEVAALYPYDATLFEVAKLLNALDQPSFNRAELEESVARAWFKPELLAPVLSRLRSRGEDKRVLLAPQILLRVLELLILHGGDTSLSLPPVPLLYLSVAEGLGSDRRVPQEAEEGDAELGVHLDEQPIEVANALVVELVANQHLNSDKDWPSLFGGFLRRWKQMPREAAEGAGYAGADPTDPEDLFLTYVGVPFTDLTTIVAAIWATALNHTVVDLEAVRTSLGWDKARFDKVLDLIAADRTRMAAAIREEDAAVTTDWTFSAFGRYPVLLLDGGRAVVTRMWLLLNRAYGWPPAFDIQAGVEAALPGAANRKERQRVIGCFENQLRDNTERYVIEILATNAPLDGPLKRLWDGRELEASYSRRGVKISDGAVEYADAWVAVEVSTRRLTRGSVAGQGPEHLLDDVKKGVVVKARQLQSTIEQLQRDEGALTGRPARERRRYVPVLVLSEGFPVNPAVRTVIEHALKDANVLQDVEGPLHIVDLEELELLEQAETLGHGTMLELLERHEQSTLAGAGLRDFLLLEVGVAGRPARLEALWGEVFTPLMDRLREQEENAS